VKTGDASRLVLELCDDEAAATAEDDADGAKGFEVPPPLEEEEFGTVRGEPEREPGAEAGTMRMRIGGGRGPIAAAALGSAAACSELACAGEVDLGAGTGGDGENELCAAVLVTAGAATEFSCALWMPAAEMGLMRAS
jgi:hypothetical protein